MSRGTTAVVNFSNLRHNFKVLSALAPGKLVLVVKADAYGHGLKQVVQALPEADCFAVATLDEAMTVRRVNPTVRVLLLEGFLNKQELTIALENKFDSVIHQQLQLDLFCALKSNKSMNIWLKFDSGMNRLGFSENQYQPAIERIQNNKHLNQLILMSHLASANQVNNPFNQTQKDKFLQFSIGHEKSFSNSSALLNSQALDNEWCRVGLSLFGVSPIENTQAADFNLKPVMTLKTNIIAIKKVKAGATIGYGETYKTDRETSMAIIGIGYGDGYPWCIDNTAYVMINQQKAAIIGRVSMDMMAVDISGIQAGVGDSVLIWGDSENGFLPIETVAKAANLIPYVLLCQITSRVHYSYVE